MKKLIFILPLFFLSLTSANATEQDIVDRSAVIIREFRHMPEKGCRRAFFGALAGWLSSVSSKLGLFSVARRVKALWLRERGTDGLDHHSSARAVPDGGRKMARKSPIS